MTSPAAPSPSPFTDLSAYVRLPRTTGLVLSPDGSRLAVSVSGVDPKATTVVSSVWDVDPTGRAPARRLTRAAAGEAAAAFTRHNDLLFTSRRPDPEAAEPDEDQAPLWLLPAAGGEARVWAARPAGFTQVWTARDADVVVVGSTVLPGAADLDADDRLAQARRKAKVNAVLHSGYPVRFWDQDLGPEQPQLLAASASDQGRATLRSLTPDAAAALLEADGDLSADGATVVSSWTRPGAKLDKRVGLVAVDVATGRRSVVREDPDADLLSPRLSPDGRQVAYLRETVSTPQSAPRVTLGLVGTDGADARELTLDWDRWPSALAWLPDGSALAVTADQDGRGPVFVVDARTGAVEQLTNDDFTYSHLAVARDGAAVFALRASYLAPAHPVRIGLDAADRGEVTVLPAPAPLPELPGTLTEVVTTTDDGTRVRAYLAVPLGAGAERPAPLLLWVHGGPLASWNAWSWRWNPWLLVAAGYAVLLPDPGLSTGYGQDFIQRGWGAWGSAPFTDLMAITDATLARDDVDEHRTAAMGGSFGGYMANWIAGHTDRFRAIVTHASLWALDGFGPTTDVGYYWNREMSPEMSQANSPHLSVAQINTPMLVVHGDHDYRVPINEGMRLWFELLTSSQLSMDEHGRTPHRFLYFPEESHWVLKPQHATLWYQVVLGFLGEHVLGYPPAPLPALLGGPKES